MDTYNVHVDLRRQLHNYRHHEVGQGTEVIIAFRFTM